MVDITGRIQVEVRGNINNQACKEVTKRKLTFAEVVKTYSILLEGGDC